MRQDRTLFEAIHEQSLDAMLIVNEIGKIGHVNAQSEALFGGSRERMLGRSVDMLVPERFRDRHSVRW